nr:TetR family transcriptional regulator [Paenibacillus sediminis]
MRERKKIKTRASIQKHALRLFREQGYHETTIEQIAEAAEISPSTFFRYFPTKEALVLEDDYDPILIQMFQEQPPELTPIQALRRAMNQGLAMIPEQEKEALRERMELTFSVPELRAASLNQLTDTLRMIAKLLAVRVGRESDDFYVMSFAGAVIGVIMSILVYSADKPDADYPSLIDEALAHLEAGFPLLPD